MAGLRLKKLAAGWHLIWGFLLLALCLGGCAREEKAQDFSLFYLEKDSQGLVEVRKAAPEGEKREQVEWVLAELAKIPKKLEYQAPLAKAFSLLSFQIQGANVLLDVDKAYNQLGDLEEVLVRAAIVKTLTGLSWVEMVGITVEGTQLHDALGNVVGLMSPQQFISNTGQDVNTYESVRLTLYFANATGDGLLVAYRERPYNTNSSLERLVAEELIRGPYVEGVYPAIDPATKVISISVKDGICYINLSQSFLAATYAVSADVTVYSLVNSLSELPGVNKVQLSVEGSTKGSVREKYPLGVLYERNLDLVFQE